MNDIEWFMVVHTSIKPYAAAALLLLLFSYYKRMPHKIKLDSKNLKGVSIANLYLKAQDIRFYYVIRKR